MTGFTLTLTLPLPPSTNALFKTVGRRRAKSEIYVAWLKVAETAARAMRVEPVRTRFEYTISVPWMQRGDISNRVKAIGDFLVSQGLSPDDRFCDDSHIRVTICRSDFAVSRFVPPPAPPRLLAFAATASPCR